jgi:hypothetical protein
MKDEAKSTALRVLCWAGVVMIPTGMICWLAHIPNAAAIAVALPFMLMAEHVFRKLAQVCGLSAPKRGPGGSDGNNPSPH